MKLCFQLYLKLTNTLTFHFYRICFLSAKSLPQYPIQICSYNIQYSIHVFLANFTFFVVSIAHLKHSSINKLDIAFRVQSEATCRINKFCNGLFFCGVQLECYPEKDSVVCKFQPICHSANPSTTGATII